MKSTLIIRLAAVLTTGLLCGSALAENVPVPQKSVSHADLNLNSSAGVAALYKRIESAATEVCQLPQGTRQLKLETELKACRADATDRAIMQANLPALSAMHLAKTGRNVGSPQYADRR